MSDNTKETFGRTVPQYSKNKQCPKGHDDIIQKFGDEIYCNLCDVVYTGDYSS